MAEIGQPARRNLVPPMTRSTRRPPGRLALRPRLGESLENRLALSGLTSLGAAGASLPTLGGGPTAAPLAVVATSPAAGAEMRTSPTSLAITFDRPLLAATFGADVLLDEVGAGGALSPVIGASNEPVETHDSTLTELIVPLASPLAPGEYRIFLSGSSNLTGLDGSTLGDGGANLDLGDFTVEQGGVTLDRATDLGTIGPAIQSASGSLDFEDDPTAVQLDKLTLAAGDWQLGLAISAEAQGSPLQSALTLFDAQGRPLAHSTQGTAADPDDPYLFDDLAAGTYYVGVSASGNIPGLAGGYDPATGSPGTAAASQAGGPFTLQAVADPITSGPILQSFQLDRADPDDSTPTGMNLGFSTAILPRDPNASVSGDMPAGLEVVDASGKAWPVSADGSTLGGTGVSFAFDEPLPEGTYAVVLPASGGLSGLGGLAPTAPGLPAGVLASFTVSAPAAPTTPSDLGPVWAAGSEVGIGQTLSIASGRASSAQFVALIPGEYKVQVAWTGGPGTIALDDLATGQSWTIPIAAPGQASTTQIELQPGVYSIEAANTGKGSLELSWSIGLGAAEGDSILANGLGQGPALNLRLISATPPSPSATSSIGPDAREVTGSTATIAASIAPAVAARVETSGIGNAASQANAAPQGPGGLFLSVGGVPVGTASPSAFHVAAVGPGANGGGFALGPEGPGLGQAVEDRLLAIASVGGDDDDGPAVAIAGPSPAVEAIDGQLISARLLASAPAKPEPAGPGWLGRLVESIGRWGDVPFLASSGSPALAAALVGADMGDPGPSDDAPEEAGFPEPLAAVLVAAAVARSHRYLGRKLRRRRARIQQASAVSAGSTLPFNQRAAASNWARSGSSNSDSARLGS